ncbi:ethanolamine ammonia-lyase subunit EutC [Aurantimonas sp. VKM B-3413]|uniref:ethanolamine ammonia-lyase subunit EutC n=1 Tax=Aurantimonas sp. VKM B-3413 TaxID=2779401 RepID=UPI001E4FBDD2|nr:ethanolamine ammonia-lyase subunit EutC [Aurantimonas sp. VKM B-3413]
MTSEDAKPPVAPAPDHPLKRLRAFTEARIGLGRHGAGLPTSAHLDFAEAHARARDAVHAGFDIEGIESALTSAGFGTLRVSSEAQDRATYLRRPDLGRRLAGASRERLAAEPGEGGFDLVLVIADGLSATAVNTYGAATAAAILGHLPRQWRVAPIILATGARVALSDPIGEALGAKIALMLVGERPGLSAADSLGAYLTFGPRPGRTDADRNCVSNIRRGGLRPEAAAQKIAGLLLRSCELGISGTGLKDDTEDRLADADRPAIDAG